jgi:hypothetical protein
MPTHKLPENNVGVNLDEADRRVLIAACCVQLFQLGFKNDIGHWRQKASGWDWFELLCKAEELGVVLRRGNLPWHPPAELRHIGGGP